MITKSITINETDVNRICNYCGGLLTGNQKKFCSGLCQRTSLGKRKKNAECRAKISATKKGTKLTEEHKHKISLAIMGRVSPLKGVKWSQESIIKRSITVIEKHKNRNAKYCNMWNDDVYKKDTRKSGCERCGCSDMLSRKLFGRTLCLHHFENNYKCDPWYLKTLCISCHMKIHRRMQVKGETIGGSKLC